MKQLFAYILISYSSLSYAQTWTTIECEPYNSIYGFVHFSTGWEPGNKQFKVNPYNGKIWMAYKYFAHGFDSDGNYFAFNSVNEPLFGDNNTSQILDFEFTSSNTYLIDAYNGVLAYDELTWSQIATGTGANTICADGDSVWVPHDNSTYSIWKDETPSIGTYSNFKRMAVRKGEIWGSGSTNSGSIAKLINDNSVLYSADTSLLLDNTNYDFKFAKKTDSLYSAGASGISIAHNGYFIDSITPYNSTNMPSASVREIEFDQNDNIWALFGSDWNEHSAIGYYDQILNEWTLVYDVSNSPIWWAGGRVSIEVDADGNLYVVDRKDLHILKVNNWPDWLSVEQLSKTKKEVVRIIDCLGRKTIEQSNKILIYEYSDGTTEKVFRVE